MYLFDHSNDIISHIKSFLSFKDRFQFIQTCTQISKLGITSLNNKKVTTIKRPYISCRQLQYQDSYVLYINPFKNTLNISIPFLHNPPLNINGCMHIVIYDTEYSYYDLRFYQNYEHSKNLVEYIKKNKHDCTKFHIRSN